MLKPLKSIAKAVASPMLDATGLYERRIQRAVSEPSSWTIVMYHRVIEDPARDPFRLGMCVLRDRFERQIRYLTERFAVLTVGEAIGRLSRGEPLPARSLSITFDDGYLDTLTRALPVLQRYGAACSVYVPTGGLEEGQLLWWDRVIAALASTRRTELDLQEVGLTKRSHLIGLHGVTAANHAEDVLNRLWALPATEQEACVDRIEQWLSPQANGLLHAQRLSVQDLQTLHRQGVEIGAHSVNHPNLALAETSRLQHELHAGRQQLQSWLQSPVSGFAYPGGHLDTAAVQAVAEAGYSYALTTQAGINRTPHDSLRLSRIGMPDAEVPDFRRSFSAALSRGLGYQHVRF
jgi:peptidoglycan/xylan/chitin deacetylase (PgdA/CDA1 family)